MSFDQSRSRYLYQLDAHTHGETGHSGFWEADNNIQWDKHATLLFSINDSELKRTDVLLDTAALW
jgi:hypothetical protein